MRSVRGGISSFVGTLGSRPRLDAIESQHEPAEQPLTEAFRLLALDVLRLNAEQAGRSIAIISAFPRDGRSLVAAFLARALSELTSPVIVLDADLHGSGVWGIPLRAAPAIEAAVSPGGPDRFWTPTTNGEGRRIGVLDQIRSRIVQADEAGVTLVIDTPAATVSSAAFAIAAAASGVIYVARQRARSGEIHADIRAQLDLLNARPLGVVFNEG